MSRLTSDNNASALDDTLRFAASVDDTPNLAAVGGLRLFRGVAPEAVEPHLDAMRIVRLEEGDVLLTPDQDNTDVYAIMEGALGVHLASADAKPLVVLTAGDCAGEMSIIEDKNPSAWVVAATDVRLLVISHDILWQMVNASHAFSRNLLVVLSERVRLDNVVIADNEDILRQYERSAMTDALTELNNRHWLEDMFRRKMQRCRRGGEPVCLAMLDIDFFKTFNDRHGHLAGDHALVTVADAVRDQFRPTDMIARFGGDEIAILLPGTDLETALKIAERVRRAIGGDTEPCAPEESDSPITVSLGIAEMGASDTLETLLNNADAALYRAKLAGRNCVSQ
ncbi:MAG: GGDEF domain-containing protein [Pseudomonadota bacterium]